MMMSCEQNGGLDEKMPLALTHFRFADQGQTMFKNLLSSFSLTCMNYCAIPVQTLFVSELESASPTNHFCLHFKGLVIGCINKDKHEIRYQL